MFMQIVNIMIHIVGLPAQGVGTAPRPLVPPMLLTWLLGKLPLAWLSLPAISIRLISWPLTPLGPPPAPLTPLSRPQVPHQALKVP